MTKTLARLLKDVRHEIYSEALAISEPSNPHYVHKMELLDRLDEVLNRKSNVGQKGKE